MQQVLWKLPHRALSMELKFDLQYPLLFYCHWMPVKFITKPATTCSPQFDLPVEQSHSYAEVRE